MSDETPCVSLAHASGAPAERHDQHRANHHDQRAEQATPDVALREVAMAEIDGDECRELEERE